MVYLFWNKLVFYGKTVVSLLETLSSFFLQVNISTNIPLSFRCIFLSLPLLQIWLTMSLSLTNSLSVINTLNLLFEHIVIERKL